MDEHSFSDKGIGILLNSVIRDTILLEREACAQLCEAVEYSVGGDMADRIRNRGQHRWIIDSEVVAERKAIISLVEDAWKKHHKEGSADICRAIEDIENQIRARGGDLCDPVAEAYKRGNTICVSCGRHNADKFTLPCINCPPSPEDILRARGEKC